jgi:hypothetical protein
MFNYHGNAIKNLKHGQRDNKPSRPICTTKQKYARHDASQKNQAETSKKGPNNPKTGGSGMQLHQCPE